VWEGEQTVTGQGTGRDNFKRIVILLFGAGPLVYIILGVLFWYLLNAYIQPSSSTEKKDLFQALGLILTGLAATFAGLAAIAGIYVTWRNLQQTQDSANENLELARQNLQHAQESSNETLELTRQGQIVDRFTQAVAQLGAARDGGAKQIEVRLGGVYALEHIAKEDLTRHHYMAVIEVLTGYLRENATWEGEDSRKDDADIQAVLSVIGRRDLRYGAGEDRTLNLSKSDLMDMNLKGAHLEGVSLLGTHLERANLLGAHLERALLSGAHLEGAVLRGTHLERAHLRGAHLEGADLRGAILKGADVAGTHLRRARAQGTDLSEVVNLTQPELEQVNGDETTLIPSHLRKPEWWRTLPPEQTPLDSSKVYSIKLFPVPLFFRAGEYWTAPLRLPNTFYLSPAGVTHVGSLLSFNYVDRVCNPRKPKEAHALEEAPHDLGKWTGWFRRHPYLEVDKQEDVTVGGAPGIQFDIDIPADRPLEYHSTCHRPCVPLFPQGRMQPNRAFQGYKNRIVVLRFKETTIAIFIEGPPDEFEDFLEKVNNEVLHTVRWGAGAS